MRTWNTKIFCKIAEVVHFVNTEHKNICKDCNGNSLCEHEN
jgi:hypothetical protein